MPSIKPSPESESIFIPAKPEPDVVPMEVDVGCVSENPGTDPESSGTRQDNPEEPDPTDPMDIDEPIPLSMIRPAPRWAQGTMSYI